MDGTFGPVDADAGCRDVMVHRFRRHRLYLAVNVPLVSAYFFLPAYHLWLWGLIGFGASGAVFAGVRTNRPVKRVP
jgi:hypothetical protein